MKNDPALNNAPKPKAEVSQILLEPSTKEETQLQTSLMPMALIPQTRALLENQKDQAIGNILEIFNTMLKYKENSQKIDQYGIENDITTNPYFQRTIEGYYFLTDSGHFEFQNQVHKVLEMEYNDTNNDLIEKMGRRLNQLAGDISDRKTVLKKEDLDVGAWDIIKAVLMVVFLPITIIPMAVNAMVGSDVCDVQTKMRLNSKVKTLLEKRAEEKIIKNNLLTV
jgi:hypothetical protein